MSDRMRPIPFARLMRALREEYEAQGSVFGVHGVFHAGKARSAALFGAQLEEPFGPAAGPHTQLAQNLLAAYAAGARFFELKTVQTLDGEDLHVAKPCIVSVREGYNCEWSTELRVQEAMDEYIKAWFALGLLAEPMGLGARDGFAFNMSVGYDYAGITSAKIDAFIEGLKDASATAQWKECTAWAKEHGYDASRISPQVCNSITLSTLHGCPAGEIERIAAYLIKEKGLNTFVKCNPTLLGYGFVRETLDALGADDIVFDDTHFRHDLNEKDAVPMFRRLQALANERGVAFGVKLTNTFPVQVTRAELPAEEMYMSGRLLFPLTAELTARLAQAFDGKLRISFCGGADAHSLRALVEAGVWPVTVATALLKPGGYQVLGEMAAAMEGTAWKPFDGVDVARAQAIAVRAREDAYYRRPLKETPLRKIGTKAPALDCSVAPCREGCPIHQDIPAYLRLMAQGRAEEAARVIVERNPLPFITGTLCAHPCRERCMRRFADCPVDIRAVKLEAVRTAAKAAKEASAPRGVQEKAVAVVGGGPAGLSVASLLARAGASVTVFEKEAELGGVVRRIIPRFRIDDAAIDSDITLCRASGAALRAGVCVRGPQDLADKGFSAVVLAVGAHKPSPLPLEEGEAVPALAFLRAFKEAPEAVSLGRNAVVAGGGNTAMDAARAALRAPGVERVTVVYRRTVREMPAAEEELLQALAEGVVMRELLAPLGVAQGRLRCAKMRLGAPGSDGRRRPEPTGEEVTVECDTLLAAIGERVDGSLYAAFGVETDANGLPRTDAQTMETNVPGVYAIGDGRGGPDTVVRAIADAALAARAICGVSFDAYAAENGAGERVQALQKRGKVYEAPCADCRQEAGRCLECATACETCVDVCPNRANVAVLCGGRVQVLHVDARCNECGNCAQFCPYDSAPYRDKLTLFASRDDFENSENDGFLPMGGGLFLTRTGGHTAVRALPQEADELPEGFAALMMQAAEMTF